MLTSLSALFFIAIVILASLLAFRRRGGGLPSLWSWHGKVGRGVYGAVGIVGFALKHNIDRAVASLMFHRPFGVFNYWIPPVDALNVSSLSRADATFLMTMVAIAL